MKIVYFTTYEPFLLYILSFSSYWLFFLKNNFFFLKKKPMFFDKLRNLNFLKKLNYRLMLNFGVIFNFFYWLSLYTTKQQMSFFCWNHCFITNSNVTLIYYIASINFFYIVLIYFFQRTNLNISTEYVFALLNLNVLVVLIFYANTLYTLIFFLELISIFIFYKFNVSKFWFNGKSQTITIKFSKLIPKYYINTLFFQYWSAFFSSVLIFYSLVNFISIYGSSEWLLMNYLNVTTLKTCYLPALELLFIIFPLFFGLFFKLGLTPVHFYKIEIYKGLPLISILFYTTYYFFIFFIFFIYLFTYVMSSFFFWTWLFYLIILTSGFLYLLSLFFDGYLLKSFFGYSTVINALNLFFVSFFAF